MHNNINNIDKNIANDSKQIYQREQKKKNLYKNMSLCNKG